ncbi:MAG: sulfatase [Planctomycetota bacterium]|jgi:arylsulfatase A-like enzyme
MSRPLRLLLVVVVLAGLGWLGFARPWITPPRTVILISLDTLRPERLGIYGGMTDTSPRIDALAANSVVFDQALAPSPWTLPSHMSMLTGLDPVAHAVKHEGTRLSKHVVTLAESLRKAGFRTAAFTDGGFLDHTFGFGAGFEIYRDRRTPDGPNGFARLLPEALDWLLASRHEDAFLFLHTFDAHSPYQEGDAEVQSRFRARQVEDGPDDHLLYRLRYLEQQNGQRIQEYGRMQALLADYDAGVFEADRGVGRVLDQLAETGRLDDALVIVTSDHGESFGENGIHVGHGLTLTEEELRIPLVVHFPGGRAAGTRRPDLVDLTSIMPTVLDVMDVPAPAEMQGESLVALLDGEPRRRDFVFGLSQNMNSTFLVQDGYKFISAPALDPIEIALRHLAPVSPPAPDTDPGEEYHRGGTTRGPYDMDGDPLGLRDVIADSPQLFRRADDPDEMNNLFTVEHERAEAMAGEILKHYERSLELAESLDDGETVGTVDVHQDQTLKQLGYLSAHDPMDQRQLLSELPLSLRGPLQNPYLAPDATLLTEADRDAHSIRLALAEGRVQDLPVRKLLGQCAERYAQWLSEHPDRLPRVAWRIEALAMLATDAGLDVDVEHWRRSLAEIAYRAGH